MMPTQARAHLAGPSRHRGHVVAPVVLALAVTVAATLLLTSAAAAQEAPVVGFDQHGGGNIFGPFIDRAGFFRNATSNPSIVNPNNSFFDPSLGSNGQACVT